MNHLLKTGIEKLLVIPGIKLTKAWPSIPTIAMVRAFGGIQLSATQLHLILRTLEEKAPCRLLVFGLGNDTVFWSQLNRGGKTVFLEDNQFWLERIVGRSQKITAHLVDYDTRRKDWKKLLESPSDLAMSLPESVGKHEWDVILVDAPAGYDDDTPGRMKSIYMASRLVTNSGDVFVHDCDREIEDTYSNHFLKNENLSSEIRSPIGYLRHYRFTGS